MKYTVYEAYTRRVAFEGTAEECWKWLLHQAFIMPNGNRVYRKWEDTRGDTHYDMDGRVYIYDGPTPAVLEK